MAIAEHMLTGIDRGDGGLLHYDLYQRIERAALLTERLGGRLFSRQVIAAIIASWEMANPNANPLG
jgi:hypothetical protein